jgi:hypothetical protein
VQLFWICARVVDVLVEGQAPGGGHPALDAPQQGCLFVPREVDARVRVERSEQGLQRGGHHGAAHLSVLREPLAFDDAHDLRADRLRRENPIDAAGLDRRTYHPVVLRVVRLLGKGEPASGLDGMETNRAVTPRAGEHHADRAIAHDLGE